MSILVFLLLVLTAGLCLIPPAILRKQTISRTQDFCVSSRLTPPAEIRNASIAGSLRVAAFGPLFAWGASGEIWPAIVSAACLGLGLLLIYALRRPMLEFLGAALADGPSVTVHAFIASRHGNDPRVRLLAACLTLLAIFGLVVAEAIAVAALLAPALPDSMALADLAALGLLVAAALGAVLSGNSGAMHSAQLQLGVAFLGLFGSAALLLYLHVSALTPMPPHGAFVIVFVILWSAAILWYRRSKYVDASVIRTEPGGASRGAKLLRKFEQLLNPIVSVFVVLVVVVAGMELYVAGLPAFAHDSIAALQTGTRLPGPALLALVLLPLLYPAVDVANWQRIAAVEKNALSNNDTPGARSAALRGIFVFCAAESALFWLFMCMFGALAVMATQTEAPAGTNVLQALIAHLLDDQNEVTVVLLPLMLAGIFAIAASAAIAMFSASLCTLRYDILPRFWPDRPDASEPAARRRTAIAGACYLLAIVAAFFLARAWLRIDVTSGAFLAALFAICCAQLSFVPLVLGPMLRRTQGRFAAVSPRSALAIMGSGAAAAAVAVIIYAATGHETWLWSAVPACLGAGLLLYGVATLKPGASTGP